MVSTVGRSLLITLAVDFGIQFLCYIVAAILKTEKFYDLSGSLTYMACILTSLLLRQEPISSLSARQIITAIFVLIWCSRLGSMLFLRILREGKDKRFDTLKQNPVSFAIPWFLQFVWIFLTAFPVYIILGNPSLLQNPLYISDGVGIVVWVFGFSIEAIADYQKNQFKNAHPHDFVSTGLWKYSRYANYNGEITLWFGMFILCANGFSESWQFVSITSPLFVAGLICGVSGIPLLEKSSEKKYGARLDYQEYKAKTSKFFLWPPKKQPTQPHSIVPPSDTEVVASAN